ncbi:hypothetical protein L7F22_063186 [Adiantum nelumboides]|nr:hypothetical protein [Adiantum nelumboides]
MKLFQEMAANIASGGYLTNTAHNNMNGTMPYMTQEHLLPARCHGDTGAAFSRPNHILHHHHQHELAEGMDETPLLQASTPIKCSTDPITTNSSSFCDANLAIGLTTDNSTSGRRQFCEISNVGYATGAVSISKVQRRFWQEALSGSDASLTAYVNEPQAMEICAGILNPQPDYQHAAELTLNVEKILNLQHIQAGVTNHNGVDLSHLVNPNNLINSSALTELTLEDPMITAADSNKTLIPTLKSLKYSGPFLPALSQGNHEAFLKQKIQLAPMEGCEDDFANQSAAVPQVHGAALFGNIEEHSDAHGNSDYMKHKYKIKQHGSCYGLTLNSIQQSDFSNKKQLIWDSQRDSVAEYHKSTQNDNDEKCRASPDPSQQNIICSWEGNARRLLGASSAGAAAMTTNVDELKSNKSSFLALQESACYNHDMPQCKVRAHLVPHVKDSTLRHSSSSTSLSTSTLIDGSTNIKSNNVKRASGKRNPLGPALNTNFKPRARQGTANDPQTIAARNRRGRINARLKVLQELVPNGSKVDLVTMLEKAINYVKYLQLQLRMLNNDELWDAKQLQDDEAEKVAMQRHISESMQELEPELEEELTNRPCSDRTLAVSLHATAPASCSNNISTTTTTFTSTQTT